jgi:DNA-binding CsgD family transcriptional regulator
MKAGGQRVMTLSEREREVLTWAAAGKPNAEIAAVLGVGTDSMDADFDNICKILGVKTRVMAVTTALHKQYVQFPDIFSPGGSSSLHRATEI